MINFNTVDINTNNILLNVSTILTVIADPLYVLSIVQIWIASTFILLFNVFQSLAQIPLSNFSSGNSQIWTEPLCLTVDTTVLQNAQSRQYLSLCSVCISMDSLNYKYFFKFPTCNSYLV